ncbi:RagB/SusD family nutrient uptake outer membrane protein [Paraflavitalea speifideaquila]|uniref:RagB/SusD family nutrient uptake outer membrane protein n=1 Tax=Paraflavitalea speifideaquila TaxID=3076558 RepID=UPI0028F103F0|nr:hypothetical protein [Paraflavitalea speifideiaquila]
MTTKRTFYTITVMAAALLTLSISSCNKQIDLLPTDLIDPTKAFRSVKDLNAGLLGAYTKLNYFSSILYTSRITDEVMLPSENNTGGGVATYRWQYDGSFEHDAWGDNYAAIDYANRVLAVIDDIVPKPGEEALKPQYKGELLALRAYCHLELIRNFAAGYVADSLGCPIWKSQRSATRPACLLPLPWPK